MDEVPRESMTFHTSSIGGESLHRIDDVYQRKNIYNKSIEENEL